jgi:hypothetical protein
VPAPATNLPAGRRIRQDAGGAPLGQGEAQLEAGAPAGRGGVGDEQLPALGLAELAGDVEAEADPAGAPGRPRVELG